MSNRELKFRAFVFSTNSGTKPNKMRYENNKTIFEWQQEGEGIHIMQYTGLHDKNGKEIYEGDILGGYPHGTVQVKWSDEWACFESSHIENEYNDKDELVDKEITSLLANDLKDCFDAWEVIGNIYESPELLNS